MEQNAPTMSDVVAQVNHNHNYQTLMHFAHGRVSIEPSTVSRPDSTRIPGHLVMVHSHGIAFDADWLSLFPLRFQDLLQQLLQQQAAHLSNLSHRAARMVKPVPQAAITELRFSKKLQDFPRCTICMEEFKSNEKVWQLHGKQCSYHKRCLSKWFKQNSTCPNCGLDCGLNA